MKKKENKIFVRLFVFSCLLIFSFGLAWSASAQALVPCGIGTGSANCTLCHLVLGFKNIYDYLLTLLLVATTTVIVVAGILYMVSSGDKGIIEKAKSAFTFALTAMILALTAWLIINTTLNALGFKNAGSWYNFTCDTAQSTNAGTTGTGGATLPPARPGEPGNCGGMKTSVANQCELVSAELQSLLSCMSGQGAPGTISSISASNIGNNFQAAYNCCGNPSCTHATYTCHYGCGMANQGYSHSVDVGTGGWSDDQLCQLASIAKQCGAGNIWGPRTLACGITYQSGHGTHLHISTGACGH